MIEDEIVLEVRKVKDALAAKFDYDVRAIAGDARERQKSSGRKVVSFGKPHPKTHTKPTKMR